MSHEIEKNTYIKIIKKNQIEMINLKSTIIEMKNLLEGFNRTFELSEAIISDLKE